ncbi:hypothetical protein BSKO_11827 [Bryopsis sp. KO-2023]|nr:hypothetical protein BSKO_11827 [Bryopsis sp. KO-2023]
MSSAKEKEAFRLTLNNALERRLFFIPSFKIYGGIAGLYDFGPPGCAIKQNIQQFWRDHFVLEEGMLEVECPAVTPEVCLQASGHVERFTDFMVTDVATGDCHRADHLLENAIEAALQDKKNPLSPEKKAEAQDILIRVGEFGAEELGSALEKYQVKAPETKNDISKPFPFNLMFKTSIGPKGDNVGYLRPETAQGIFVNFKELLYYNGNKLPFAAAQIGQSYRNEISPRAGLLRVREFTQAEIEYFVAPNSKDHSKFHTVKDLKPLLFSQALQNSAEKQPQPMAFGEAVSKGVIANETLGYFMGRTYLFMQKIGIDVNRLRFRQHLEHEMAHYAEDCWDCEIETSYGWVECVGLADRSAFDLKAHSVKSKIEMVAYEKYDEPRMEEVLTVVPNRKELGKTFKKDQKAIVEAFEGMCEPDLLAHQAKLSAGESSTVSAGGKDFEILPSMMEIKQETKKVNGRSFVPSVIEPSFGIGRIIYAMFEHTFMVREGAKTIFKFTPLVAPTKTTVFSLVQKPDLTGKANEISASLTAARIANIVDTGGTTIGKRYARTDELGVPYAVTVDYGVFKDATVTLRERDSTAQVRVPESEVASVIRMLVDGVLSWGDVENKYPAEGAVADGGAE